MSSDGRPSSSAGPMPAPTVVDFSARRQEALLREAAFLAADLVNEIAVAQAGIAAARTAAQALRERIAALPHSDAEHEDLERLCRHALQRGDLAGLKALREAVSRRFLGEAGPAPAGLRSSGGPAEMKSPLFAGYEEGRPDDGSRSV
ncbi:hypothetical protein [Arenibaculum pallidiluteum]|uniref:hypothetical protein n=1 Tax=Arenibaculum pallidiluteum TaxID=2812559 RepID=UPI001A96C2C1|nr:hypothetical protein [Arenibaculum pallidiluteum]